MICPICLQNEAHDTHHIFQGARRKVSDKYKDICTVKLCRSCHRLIHDGKLDAFDLMLKQKAQKKFEDLYGHEKWMKEFRRNYRND